MDKVWNSALMVRSRTGESTKLWGRQLTRHGGRRP